MAVQNFIIELIEALLDDKALALTEQDIRFYDKGTTAENDESLDDHVRWQNARYFNEDSNIIRSSMLIIQLTFEKGTEYLHFQVGDIYRLYRKGGLQGVLPVIREDILSMRTAGQQQVTLMNQFGDYEAIKDRLIIRPLNYDDNEKVLEKGIFRRMGDVALVLYIDMGRAGEKGNILSTMVKQDLFQRWNVEEEATLNWAMENTMRLQPPVFRELTGSSVPGLEMRTIHFMEEDCHFDFDSPMAPLITTEQEVNGAVAFFYPGVLDRLYELVGGDFYVLFTSIYDVHVHTVGGKLKVSSMRTTLADTNRVMNKRGEVLSRQLYRYDGETKEIVEVPK